MYKEIVAFAEIEQFMDQKLKNYSSGMQVRLAFSIAIRANTDILVLDEVLAVGDESFQRKCFEYFKQLKKDKKTVILVTHDMGAAKKFCDRAILLDKGKLVASGSPDDVTNQYTLENLAKISGDKGRLTNGPWITIEPKSKLVLGSSEEFKCRVVYYTPNDVPVSFGISIIDGATNRATSVVDDGITGGDGKQKITSRKKGKYSFDYSIPLDSFNDRDFEITAVLYQYVEDYDEFTPYAFINEGDIPHFVIRGGRKDNGLLKLKGRWQ
jgi:ABC-2 type transport system ATP-binding protein